MSRRVIRVAFDESSVSKSLQEYILKTLTDRRGWRSIWPWLSFEVVHARSAKPKPDLVWHTQTLEDTYKLPREVWALNVYMGSGLDHSIYLVKEYIDIVPKESEHVSRDSYLTYAINHEFGHFLQARTKEGEIHVDRGTCTAIHSCDDLVDIMLTKVPTSGAPERYAAIMTQQTKGVSPCVPNPWPTEIDSSMLDESRFWDALRKT